LSLFSIRGPFQIVNPIVRLDTVFVIDGWLVIGIGNECLCRENMNVSSLDWPP